MCWGWTQLSNLSHRHCWRPKGSLAEYAVVLPVDENEEER
jgi:hypothetical protein